MKLLILLSIFSFLAGYITGTLTRHNRVKNYDVKNANYIELTRVK